MIRRFLFAAIAGIVPWILFILALKAVIYYTGDINSRWLFIYYGNEICVISIASAIFGFMYGKPPKE